MATLHYSGVARRLVCAAALFTALFASGCGGGGGNTGAGTTTTGTGSGAGTGGTGTGATSQAGSDNLSGAVSDINGNPFVGATVTAGSQSAASTQAGIYQISAVPIAAGQLTAVQQVTAQQQVNGRLYTGSNMVQMVRGASNAAGISSNVQVVMSPANWQGSIKGTVVDAQGNPISGAVVSASAPAPAGNSYFINPGSFVAYTNSSGAFQINNLPPLGVSMIGNPPAGGATGSPYTVTASAPYYSVTQSSQVAVTSGAVATVQITMQANKTVQELAQATAFAATSITVPTTASRAAGSPLSAGGLNALTNVILRRRNLLGYHSTSLTHALTRTGATRAAPAGSIVASILTWDYAAFNNLLGYDVLRSAGNATSFQTIALLYDPLGDRYSDIDTVLTPDTTYYYSVARLDTFGFPSSADEGNPVNAAAVDPLQPLTLTAPQSSAAVSSTPTFQWAAVNRAALYQVLVYSQMPNYQSDTEADGVAPIWPASLSSPGSSLVQSQTGATAYSATYGGPALQKGHTYYWAVIAQDSVGSANSVSQIYSFTVN